MLYCMQVVFFLNKLHSHIDRTDYEQWVRSIDYPTAQSIPSILEYTVARVEGRLDADGTPPYDYVERVVIGDTASYRRDLADARLDDFRQAWSTRIAESTAVHATVVE